MALYPITRRPPRPDDVEIDILYCGVCHSDLHTARNDWGWTHYPIVPGHEIIGRVVAVGSQVSKFKVGDQVGVGCMVDSCGHCDACTEGHEQHCRERLVLLTSPGITRWPLEHRDECLFPRLTATHGRQAYSSSACSGTCSAASLAKTASR
nr:alcohol dehydrogenase catalytic domain-containing protein [Aeromonas salmonicida]